MNEPESPISQTELWHPLPHYGMVGKSKFPYPSPNRVNPAPIPGTLSKRIVPGDRSPHRSILSIRSESSL